MTLTVHPQKHVKTWQSPYASTQRKNSAQALKRYLDLTLTGTKKSLSSPIKQGRKGHPTSPYTYDRPDVEKAIQEALLYQPVQQGPSKTPDWVQRINEKVCNHSGEAPMFTEKLLPTNKLEQVKLSPSRPLSGISAKSAPIIINGEMYYRPNKKHSYLQASNRPSSAKENRLTRASKLRNKQRSAAMSIIPSNDTTKLLLKRMKSIKPSSLYLNKDLLPIPCHVEETPHSFIIGARYNCSNFMDSRSYSRFGLYIPRQNPRQSFLASYKMENMASANESEFAGNTSVRGSNAVAHTQYESRYYRQCGTKKQSSMPKPHVRKVVREAWLTGNLSGVNVDRSIPLKSSSSPHINGHLSKSPKVQSTSAVSEEKLSNSKRLNLENQKPVKDLSMQSLDRNRNKTEEESSHKLIQRYKSIT